MLKFYEVVYKDNKMLVLASLNNIAHSTDCCQRSTMDFQKNSKIQPLFLQPFSKCFYLEIISLCALSWSSAPELAVEVFYNLEPLARMHIQALATLLSQAK